MSSTAITPASQLNGHGVARTELQREAEFLDQLLRLRDEVLAGKHPRIQLPPAVLEQVAPRPNKPRTPAVPSRPTTSGASNGSQPLKSLPPRPESSAHYQHTPSEHSLGHTSRPFSNKSASSGIDPVLLQKSDNLIRAELQLKRQQIERAVKDQFDKRGRANDAMMEDREPYFDVEDALAKAQTLVKPISGLQQPTARNSERSTSFDENSYYSSQANSWSSEGNESNRTAHAANIAEPLAVHAQNSATGVQLTADKPDSPTEPAPTQVQPAVIDLDEEPYEPVDDIGVYEPDSAQAHGEDEESDYSPPPAAAGPSEIPKGRQRGRAVPGRGANNGSSRRQSPAGNPAPLQNPRKRRREEKREEKRRQQANKRVVRSPEPYIKEEPQSPPPFASYPDSQPNKRRALEPHPQDVELVSARDGRLQHHYTEQDRSPRSYRPYEEPASPTVIRVPQRRLERDDQDLRRVASLQNARRPYSPGAAEPYHPLETRPIRSESHAFTDRPVEPVFREVPARPLAGPRYVRERSRSPVREYLSRAQSPVLMAPPARRIVVDQFGNKYYAAPVEVDESVPAARRIEAEPYYERAITREPAMRGPARVELYEEDNIARMPPPPPRRYVAAQDAELGEARTYRQRETSHRPIGVEYSTRGAAERRPVIQYEDMGPPREYVPSRAYSVRPEVVRREVPDEYTSVRHESVAPRYVSVAAPRYREVSVVHQEPLDERRYAFAAPSHGRRYVEEGAVERPMEVVQEPFEGEARRVSYRY